MSRTYLLKVFFDKPYPKCKFETFFTNWCGKNQIFRIGTLSVTCEMGCSGGVLPEDAMNELYKQLRGEGFKITIKGLIAYPLNDNAIYIDPVRMHNFVKDCPHDYNKHHRWERIGCDREMIIYQCSQCRKCAFERIEIIGNIKDV